ncbi:hypothetical protein [Actinoplanes sp. NPDC051411]|uniref:hypothetical protein n=1 Tax=Actinoplanes sp. NPDC051411 TaxID=3155522 RepID=UPI003432065C
MEPDPRRQQAHRLSRDGGRGKQRDDRQAAQRDPYEVVTRRGQREKHHREDRRADDRRGSFRTAARRQPRVHPILQAAGLTGVEPSDMKSDAGDPTTADERHSKAGALYVGQSLDNHQNDLLSFSYRSRYPGDIGRTGRFRAGEVAWRTAGVRTYMKRLRSGNVHLYEMDHQGGDLV